MVSASFPGHGEKPRNGNLQLWARLQEVQRAFLSFYTSHWATACWKAGGNENSNPGNWRPDAPCYNLGIAKLSADSKKDTKESKNMTCSAPVTLQQLKSFRLVPRSLKSPTPMRCGAVGISRSHPSPALRRSTSALSRATWRSTANEQRVVDPTGWNPKTWVHTVYTQLWPYTNIILRFHRLVQPLPGGQIPGHHISATGAARAIFAPSQLICAAHAAWGD